MSTLHAGFADPVGEAQACFRAVLEAMSRPGTIVAAGAGLAAPTGLDPATAAVLLTLADAETPVFLDAACAAARPWITFHCGAPEAATLSEAVFVVTAALPKLASLPAGTHDDPELSATVILQVAAIGSGTDFQLEGPGLAAPRSLSVQGLPADFATLWAANLALYPRGVDLILCAGERIAALPRTTGVTRCDPAHGS